MSGPLPTPPAAPPRGPPGSSAGGATPKRSPIRTRAVQRRRAPHSATRWALAVTVAAVVFVGSYAIQRLARLAFAEADPTAVVLLATTPFYWRVGLALVHAGIAVPLVGFAIDDDQAVPLLRFAPLWVPCLVLPLALLMVAFP
ncbi:MAG: hypothetical protein ABMB14_38105 [Myxococcota bacterium]